MKRFYLDEWPPIADAQPEVTARVRQFIKAGRAGTMRAEDFTPELWAQIEPHQKAIQDDLNRLGALVAVKLVRRAEAEDGAATLVYRVEYEKVEVLQSFTFDHDDRLAASRSEFREIKPGETL